MRLALCRFQTGQIPPTLAGMQLAACPLGLTHLPKHGEKLCPAEYLQTPEGWPNTMSPCSFPMNTRTGEQIPMGPAAVEWARGQGLPVATPVAEEKKEPAPVTTYHRNGNGSLTNVQTGETRPGLTSAEHKPPAATPTKAADVGEPEKKRRGRPRKYGQPQREMFDSEMNGTSETNETPKESPMSATATATSPTASPIPTSAPTSTALWGPQKIPFIAGTGEYQSGKSLFGCFIDKDSVCVMDAEGSVEPYEMGLGFKPCRTIEQFRVAVNEKQGSLRVDLSAIMAAKFRSGEFRAIDRYVVWIELIRMIPVGRFRVIMQDPISEIESALPDLIRQNPQRWGYTPNQINNSTALLWGAAKESWKQTLSADLMTRCETFYCTAHMREEFKGGKPTGKREPKGKDTIMELASLYLLFERRPDEKGGMPEKPTATVIKSRLSNFIMENGELTPKPALPPRIRDCSPGRLRWYFQNPPDYSKLKKDERVEERTMTADEKALLEAQTAADRRATEEAALSRTQLQVQAMQQKANGGNGNGNGSHVATPAPDQSGVAAQARNTAAIQQTARQEVAPTAVSPVAPAAESNSAAPEATTLDSSAVSVPMISDTQRQDIKNLLQQLQANPEKIKAKIKELFNADKLADLTFRQADEFAAGLGRQLEKRRMAAEEQKAFVAPVGQTAAPQTATDRWAGGEAALVAPGEQQPPFATQGALQ